MFRFYSWLLGRQIIALVQTIPDLLYLGMCTPGVPNLLDDKIGAGQCHLGGRYLSTLIPKQRRWHNLNARLSLHFAQMTLVKGSLPRPRLQPKCSPNFVHILQDEKKGGEACPDQDSLC